MVPAVCELFICSKLVKTFLSNKTSLPLPSSNTISQTPLGYRDAFLVSLGKKGHGLQSEAFPSRSRPSQGLMGHLHLLDVGAWPGRARGRAQLGIWSLATSCSFIPVPPIPSLSFLIRAMKLRDQVLSEKAPFLLAPSASLQPSPQ